jgi:hypothetical protein
VALIAAALLAVAWTHLSGNSNFLYRGGLLLCGLAVTIVIAAAVHPQRGPISTALSFKPLCALGIISYGVYLWHWPIYIVLDRSRMHFGGRPLLAVQIFVTIVVALASFRFVERPIRRGTGVCAAPRARTIVFASGTALAVVAAAVLVSTARAPAPETLKADPIRSFVPPTTTPVQVVGHSARPAAPAPVAPPRVLVVGDSIALLGGDEGFKRLQTTPPLDVLNLGSVGCRFLPEEQRQRDDSGELTVDRRSVCRERWADAVAAFQPNVVVMLIADPGNAVHELNGQWTQPCGPAYAQVFGRELHDQIELLAAKGARVVVATAPYLGLPYRPRSWFTNDDCQNDLRRHVVASEPKAILADVFKWMCPRQEAFCKTHLGGMVLRPDGMHFRHDSARLLASFVIAVAKHRGALPGVRDNTPEAQLLALSPSR